MKMLRSLLLVLGLAIVSANSAEAAALVRLTCGTKGNIFAGGTTNSGTPTNLAGGNIATTGNLMVVFYFSQNDNRVPNAATDTAGTTYVAAGLTQQGGPGYIHIFYGFAAANSAGQGTYVTVSGNNGDTSMVCVAEVSGISSDQTNIQNNRSGPAAQTTHNSGTVTPNNATGIIFAMRNITNADIVEDSNFVEDLTDTPNDNFWIGHIINAPTSARQLTYTSTDPEDSLNKIVAFVGTAGASNAPRADHYRRLMTSLHPAANDDEFLLRASR